ncbi:MAG: hypothetical protein K2Q18_17345 [Bdellovibrionales bacterium]|nr:hypothetical protein [Bdellovibrionales bacterium]
MNCIFPFIMKTKINKLACILGLTTLLASAFAQAGESFIPLQKGLRPASDDLIYNGDVLSSRDADALLKNQNLDLSKLQPKENDIWGAAPFNVLDQNEIAIKDGDFLTYEGSIASNEGLFRFNAIPVNGNKVYTIHLDKSLHTILMRKNLLRALGYKVPAMKYLKTITVKFPSAFAMETFMKREVPEGTLGAVTRWSVPNLVVADQLTLTLQDVAVTEPNEYDFYNVSLGVPTETINSRTLRSLIIPYSLVDLGESVNKFPWVAGKTDNNSIILGHFTGNDFATTIDDANWMIAKMNRLSRADLQKIVSDAYFPKEVEAIVLEKLVARRNSFNNIFSTKVADLAYDSKITIGKGEVLKEGKLNQKEFPGYASRFAHGDAESPFEQLKYFLYSKVQSEIIDNLLGKANSELDGFDLGEKRVEYFTDQFKKGLDHYVQTGELLPIKVGTWYSPIVSPRLIISRDIILGNYLGTDNLVQLADTFGAGADLGVFVGIEGLGNDLGASVKATTTFVRSYTHLKPVKNLKESIKEPYKNIFVGMLKRSLKEKFYTLSELQKINTDGTASEDLKKEQKKKIEDVFTEMNQKLNVGESLIITDRLMPSASVRVSFSQGLIGAGVGVTAGVTILKRIHLYKKSATVLQIYDDSGFVKSIDLSFQVSKFINLVKLTGSVDKGHYNVNSYMVNLNSNLAENPDLFSNALGVYNVLKNKDFSLLNKNAPPVRLDVQFKDKSLGFSVLFWKMKSLKGKTYYDIKAKDGVEGTYYSVEKDFLTGLNPEAFSRQILNYYISKEVEDIQIKEEGNKNPGETLFGRSRTKKIRYEAVVDAEKKFGQKFLSYSDVKQGWAMSERKLKGFMDEVNSKFQAKIFDANLIDFKKLRLYNVGYHVNIYNRGLEKLKLITEADITKIETKYQKGSRFCPEDSGPKDSPLCGNLGMIKYTLNKCPKAKDEEALADCHIDLFEKLLSDLDFDDLKNIIGLDNLYIYGTVDGFREKSEILNDTLPSNALGKIGSKQWNGPMDVVRNLLGLAGGELSGGWIRQGL